MRSLLFLAVVGVGLVGCASGPSTAACVEASSVASLPRWMQPAPTATAPESAVASRTLFVDGDRRGTIRIAPEAERDPLAEAMGARGRWRIHAMSLREAPVTDTLRLFAEIGGFNVVFSDDIPGRTVTLNLREVSVLGAFRTVLAAAHLGADAPEGGIVSVRPREGGVATR